MLGSADVEQVVKTTFTWWGRTAVAPGLLYGVLLGRLASVLTRDVRVVVPDGRFRLPTFDARKGPRPHSWLTTSAAAKHERARADQRTTNRIPWPSGSRVSAPVRNPRDNGPTSTEPGDTIVIR